MGEVIFSDTHSSQGVGSATYDVRLTYSETYNASTRKTTVQVTAVDIRKRNNTTNWYTGTMYGSIVINGTTVMSVSGGASYTCHIDGSGWCRATLPSISPVSVSHNDTTGAASMTIGVVGGNNGYFCTYFHWYSPGQDDITFYGGVTTQSTTVNLTTRAATLSVNPDNGGAVSTYTRATGYSMSITAPSKAGYSFNGWSLTGGGSISGNTYTFGSTNGTLVARWIPNTYTLSIDSDSGAEIHVYKSGTEIFNGDSITYGDVLNLSITPKPGYQIDSRSPLSDTVTVTGALVISVVTSPMATIHIMENGVWNMYLMHIRQSGQWELHQANIRQNGQWVKYF